jgi:hypothetical protein
VRRALLVGLLGTALVIGGSLAVSAPTSAITDAVAAHNKVASVDRQHVTRWNELVQKAQAGKLSDDAFADVIEKELLPPWREAHAYYAKAGRGSQKADMLAYLVARQEACEIIVKGLRAHDEELIKKGMARYQEGDAIIARVNLNNAVN